MVLPPSFNPGECFVDCSEGTISVRPVAWGSVNKKRAKCRTAGIDVVRVYTAIANTQHLLEPPSKSFYREYDYKENGKWENYKWKVLHLPNLCVLDILHSQLCICAKIDWE